MTFLVHGSMANILTQTPLTKSVCPRGGDESLSHSFDSVPGPVSGRKRAMFADLFRDGLLKYAEIVEVWYCMVRLKHVGIPIIVGLSRVLVLIFLCR